jgi:hypothetical protein
MNNRDGEFIEFFRRLGPAHQEAVIARLDRILYAETAANGQRGSAPPFTLCGEDALGDRSVILPGTFNRLTGRAL